MSTAPEVLQPAALPVNVSPQDVERFFAKVNREGPIPEHAKYGDIGACWVWTAALYGNGYGHFVIQKRGYLAHRLAWEIQNGKIPDRLLVMHVCDRKNCCRVSHLVLGTHSDNSLDMVKKKRNDQRKGKDHPSYGRIRTHCNNGHPLADDNVYFTNHGLSRRCLICYRASSRAAALRYISRNHDKIIHRRRELRGGLKGVVRGALVNTAKLTEAKVLEIRRLYSETKIYQYELARMFGVSQPNIGSIILRQTWKHVKAVAELTMPHSATQPDTNPQAS